MDFGSRRYSGSDAPNALQNQELTSNRNGAPLWPPSRGAYQNLASTEEHHLQDTPTSLNSGRPLLGSGLSPSPYQAYTPTAYTPHSEFETPILDKGLYDAPDSPPPPKEKSSFDWFGQGWRGGARLAFFGTILVLWVNVGLMVGMTLNHEWMDGFPVIYRGTCEEAEKRNTIIHLAINVLGTIVLAGSNYCMQLLSAPNRRDIDKAHQTGHWLDIGIASLRNLRFLSVKKQILYWLLALSSLPLHLIYNSTFYPAIATNNYNILFAQPDFVEGASYDAYKFPDSAAQNISGIQLNSTRWQRLENPDCIAAYSHDFVTAYRNVIAVVDNVTSDESLLAVNINELPASNYLGGTYDAFSWICNDTQTINKTGVNETNAAGFTPCSWQVPALEKLAPKWWKSNGFRIQYCLAEAITPDCHLHFAPQFMGPVILMNLLKIFVMYYVAYRLVDQPLVTLGDAIESFIRSPDPTTQGMCLISARQIEYSWSRKTAPGSLYTPAPERFSGRRHHWAATVTRRQWLLLISLFILMFAGLGVALYFGITTLAPPTIQNAWSLGIGNIRTQNLILGTSLPQLGASAVLITALVANAPQSLFSFLYMVYNTIFTSMFVGEDWDHFGAYHQAVSGAGKRLSMLTKRATHRYLRTSDPKGSQKSTYFLALPYRYALPLIALSGLLHWLLSQTIFLANISVIPRDGTLPRHDEITTCAYSPQGMIWLMALGGFMLAFIVANAARKYGGEMILVAQNSAAISAACHVNVSSKQEREKLIMRKLAWGEIPEGRNRNTKDDVGLGLGGFQSPKTGVYDVDELERMGRVSTFATSDHANVGHCSFSSGAVFKPTSDKLYA